MTVDRPSLDTEAARDVDGRAAAAAVDGSARGVGAFEGGGGSGNSEENAVIGGFAAAAAAATAAVAAAEEGSAVVPLRLRLMMLVSSFLNFSRSVYATGCGDVKVKLWPVSSSTRPSFSLTCAAPSLLQNRAIK